MIDALIVLVAAPAIGFALYGLSGLAIRLTDWVLYPGKK